MPDSNFVEYLKEAGGIFKFGSGVLGKSAIVLGILMGAVAIGAWRLHSDVLIIVAIGSGAVIFFGWLFPVLIFASKHPDVALLEGAEWSGYQRFQAAAKNYVPALPDKEPSFLPGPQSLLPSDGDPEVSEEDEQ